MTKNKALCLLFAILVSTFIMGCEGRFVTFYEGMGHMGGGGGGSDPCAGVSDLNDATSCEGTMSSDGSTACVYTAASGDDPNATDYQAASCAAPPAQSSQCSSYQSEQECVSPCNWENGACNDQ